MRMISYCLALAASLVLCQSCCKWSEPKTEEQAKVNFVESELLEIQGSKPFYWFEGQRMPLTPQLDGQQYVLCHLPPEVATPPEGWRLSPFSNRPILYSAKDFEPMKQQLVYAVLPRGEQPPKPLLELYRGDSYLTASGGEPLVMSDCIVLELAEKARFRDLADLAEALNLIILGQEPLDPQRYTLSARNSAYPVWQVAHVLHRHAAVRWAAPEFLGQIEALKP